MNKPVEQRSLISSKAAFKELSVQIRSNRIKEKHIKELYTTFDDEHSTILKKVME